MAHLVPGSRLPGYALRPLCAPLAIPIDGRLGAAGLAFSQQAPPVCPRLGDLFRKRKAGVVHVDARQV